MESEDPEQSNIANSQSEQIASENQTKEKRPEKRKK
jgi:hypothetical protein